MFFPQISFAQESVFFPTQCFCPKRKTPLLKPLLLKRYSEKLRFLTTLGQCLLFSQLRYNTYLIVGIVWFTGYWTNFTIFWTDLNFCKYIWNVISFLHSKGWCSGLNFLQTNWSLVNVVRKRFRATIIRLNLFRLGLQFFLKCLEWVSLPMTSVHLWNWPKNSKSNDLLNAKRMLKPKYKLSGGPVVPFTLPGRGNLQK